MKVSSRVRALHPRNVFRISRGARSEAENVFLRVERDGVAGFGEASPNAYYGEDAAAVVEKLAGAGEFLAKREVKSADDIAEIWKESWSFLKPSRAAQCALDLALWDWLGKAQGLTVCELTLGHRPHRVGSFATIGITEPEELSRKMKELEGFTRVKVKLDGTGDLSVAERVRAEMPEATLALDANCAWEGLDLEELAPALRRLRVSFVEQPYPPEGDQRMEGLGKKLGLVFIADESCVRLKDVERIQRRFAGFNIKLVKCGGLTPALWMARRGRQLDNDVMVGCMLESSVMIAAGAVVAQWADHADLDGAWLLADDPARGWAFHQGVLTPPAGPGLGVVLEEGIFAD